MDFLPFLLDKNNIFIVAIALASGIMLAIPALRKGRPGAAVSTAEAIQLINQRHAVWVDIRPTEQFQTGHIAQARSLPSADIEKKASSLPKNKPLVVVCDNGRESSRAVAQLRAQGYTEAVVLDGGIRAWQAASLPITQKI